MLQTEPEKKKGFLDRLPKLGRASQLFLVVIIFAVLFGLLFWFNQKQPENEASLNNTLSNLQKIVGVEQTPKDKFEAELAQVTAETEAAQAVFPKTSQAPEILDTLLELAQVNDLSITQTKVSTTLPGSTTTKTTSTTTNAIGPVLTIEVNLKGQVPKFQNFLLALDSKLPTSQIRSLIFTAAVSATEEDTADIIIDIFCYEGSQ